MTNEAILLLPLEVMVRPLELRFRYHFNGDKPTNRLDKPEYFLSHIIDLLNTYNDFMITYLQPILDARSRKANLDLDWAYSDATAVFIAALLPMVRQKISILLPQISPYPQALSHFMHELMSFDTQIRDDWAYSPVSIMDTWKGLSWEVLVKQNYFPTWLDVEKSFALSRYEAIINAPDNGEIDHDGVEPGTTKPTKASIRVNDLLETITDRYRPLSSLSQKLRFLIDIQITIFDQFHERLRSSLEAYLAMTSTLGRTVQGTSGNKDSQTSLHGVAGLERLCRVFGSAEYLEKKMRDWSDDVFFLDLWAELQDHAKQNSGSGRPLAGAMSISDIASRTSSAVDDGSEGGALFDETASAYRRLRLRSESIIQDKITDEIRAALKRYSRVAQWSSLSSSSNPANPLSSLAPTAELDTALQILSSSLIFLATVLAPAPLRRITRQVLLAMQTYLWDNVLMTHSFSFAGAMQFRRDVEAVCGIVDRALVKEGEGARGLRKVGEGLFLLGLPAEGSEVNGTDRNSGGDDDGDGEEKVWGLWEVEKRVFRSNESAREVLGEIGLDLLSESDARGILVRRVEVGHL